MVSPQRLFFLVAALLLCLLPQTAQCANNIPGVGLLRRGTKRITQHASDPFAIVLDPGQALSDAVSGVEDCVNGVCSLAGRPRLSRGQILFRRAVRIALLAAAWSGLGTMPDEVAKPIRDCAYVPEVLSRVTCPYDGEIAMAACKVAPHNGINGALCMSPVGWKSSQGGKTGLLKKPLCYDDVPETVKNELGPRSLLRVGHFDRRLVNWAIKFLAAHGCVWAVQKTMRTLTPQAVQDAVHSAEQKLLA